LKNLKAIRRVLYITMGLNLAAMAAKLAVGYWTGALSLIADGFDSLFDGAANVIGLVGIYIAARPADREHPYGHRKFETMAAIGISVLLFVTTWELLQSAWERLRHPDLISPVINAWSFGALLLSIAVHITVVLYELRAGRRLKSDVLVADAMHTKADIYISVSVIIGLIAVRLGYPIVDPLLALVIAVLIAKIGIDIVRESSKTLLDGAVVPISEIERIVMGVRDVRACHDIRSRGHEDAIHVDLHVQVDPELSTTRSHAIAHEVRHRLQVEIPSIEDVVVHIEPRDGSRPDASPLIPVLRRMAEEAQVEIHDIDARQVAGEYTVEAHLVVDGAMPLGRAHDLASEFERRARSEIPGLVAITTHIEPHSDARQERGGSAIGANDVVQRARELVHAQYKAGSCHDVKAYPLAGNWAITLHCSLDKDMTLEQAHAISSRIETGLRDAVPRLSRVTVHTEPQSRD
jgi:cation diffusion facilitator family transporter